MAAPWHRRDSVNNSRMWLLRHVGLAGEPQTGHSAPEFAKRELSAVAMLAIQPSAKSTRVAPATALFGGFLMPDAVKVGFVPFSSASRGILVVFCDDGLKFGPATSKALGSAAGMIRRAATANHFKGKSAATLDFLAPEGVKASRLILVGTGKASDL